VTEEQVMDQSDNEKCYVDGCEADAHTVINKLFVDRTCKLCKMRAWQYLKTCSTHDNKPFNYNICPKTNALKCNYYDRKDLYKYYRFHDVPELKYHNKILKFRNDYVFIIFHRKGLRFNRMIHICDDIYKQRGSLSDDILYDLTRNYTLNELKKDRNIYFGTLPRDIIGIIMLYL
jgi:hypothetical protein